VLFTGFKGDTIDDLPSWIVSAMQSPGPQREGCSATSTAVSMFVPRDPREDDGYIVLSVGSQNAWSMIRAFEASI
jgi:hypothetical protein